MNRQDVVGETRTNSVASFGLTDVELLDVLLQVKMSSACGVPMNHMEAPAVLHYGVGEEASNHYDFVNPDTPDYAGEIARNGQRIVTFLVYLNDDYEGGETGFPTLGFSHKGRRGQGLFFVNAHADLQPDRRMLHAVGPRHAVINGLSRSSSAAARPSWRRRRGRRRSDIVIEATEPQQ